MANEQSFRVQEGKVEKGSTSYGEGGGARDGFKPSAPQNVKMPNPVAVPPPPQQNSKK